MQGEPVYFGDERRPLAGWLHLPPNGQLRAGVLLCPSLGREMMFAYASVRQLAIELADLGFAVLRFDYDGTGDSAGGPGDPDRLRAWQESVHEGLDHLEALGASTLSVVALRTGALLAASALDGAALDRPLRTVDSLVLWDPMLSGRVFLRDMRMLVRLTTNAAEDQLADGAVHGHSAVFPPELARSLAALTSDDLVRVVARDVLLLHRRDVLHDEPGARRLGESVTVLPVDGQEALLERDPPLLARPAIALVTAHLDRVLPREEFAVRPLPRRQTAAVADRQGRPAAEQFWSSADGVMHGVLTTPLDVSPPGAAHVMMLPSGVGHHVGLGRMWVELARECAAQGVTVLRLDPSGLGDSDAYDGEGRGRVFTPEGVRDVVQVAQELRVDDPAQVRLVGHCASAWTVLKAARELRSVSVHPVNFTPYTDVAAVRAELSEAPVPSPGLAHRFLKLGRRPWIEKRRSQIPEWVWSGLQLLRLLPSPVREFEVLAAQGTRVQVVSDDLDGAFFIADGRRALRRLPADRFALDLIPVNDHAMASASARRGVAAALVRELVPQQPTDTPERARTASSSS